MFGGTFFDHRLLCLHCESELFLQKRNVWLKLRSVMMNERPVILTLWMCEGVPNYRSNPKFERLVNRQKCLIEMY